MRRASSALSFGLALGALAPASVASQAPFTVLVRAETDAVALARELDLRLPDASVIEEGSASVVVRVVTPTPPDGSAILRVEDGSANPVARFDIAWNGDPQAIREAAVLAEGAIRLHRSEVEAMLARLAADVPLLALTVYGGARAWLDAPHLVAEGGLAFRVRLVTPLTFELAVESGLPIWGDAQDVAYTLVGVGGRLTAFYAIPFDSVVAQIGVGLEGRLFVARFDLPTGARRDDVLVYGIPTLTVELEWPRDSALRGVLALRGGYALSYPDVRYQGLPVVSVGPWSVNASLGLRWLFSP
ncbi:MAG: hypothetical protein AB7S26_18550 [Sandaracinaceae bacterium]